MNIVMEKQKIPPWVVVSHSLSITKCFQNWIGLHNEEKDDEQLQENHMVFAGTNSSFLFYWNQIKEAI